MYIILLRVTKIITDLFLGNICDHVLCEEVFYLGQRFSIKAVMIHPPSDGPLYFEKCSYPTFDSFY